MISDPKPAPIVVTVEVPPPQYPVAGASVAKEIDDVCRPRDRCAALFEWLGRIAKLAEQLSPDKAI